MSNDHSGELPARERRRRAFLNRGIAYYRRHAEEFDAAFPDDAPAATPAGAAGSSMLLDEFEAIERAAPETVWLEFLSGRLEVKPTQDGSHGAIVMWLLERCVEQCPDRNGRYRARVTLPFGDVVPVPEPVGITLETEKLKDYAR